MNNVFNVQQIAYENHSEGSEGNFSYEEALEYIKNYISHKYSKDLAGLIYEGESEKKIKELISKCIYEFSINVKDISKQENLVNKIYDDMAGYAFLTKYIDDKNVEEINGNSWDDIEIVTKEGALKLEEHFLSPKHCLDVVRKMVKAGGMIIDEIQPAVDSYISKGIRISAIIPPVVDSDCGAVFSIRKQKDIIFSKEELIHMDTVAEEELDFLTMCIENGISVSIAGATGSGKTTDIKFLLNEISDKYRIFCIEDSRELNLLKKDNDGRTVNSIIQTQTRPGVSADDLLKKALRFDPDIIVPAEMRGEEAMTAQEAGRTGHAILTTLHASTAFAAYTRILTMCMKSGTRLSEDIMMKLIIEAFPIMAFKKQLSDKSRKYMKVIEAEDYINGRIQARILYRYVITGNRCNKGKNHSVEGYHKRENNISDKLARRLIENGADIGEVERYAGKGWMNYE